MRVLVFGAGAIGSLVGGLLSRDHEVTLVGRAAHMDAIRRRGLRISGETKYIARPATATAVPAGAYDVIFVTTKAYDTAAAVDALRPFWRRSLFVTLQNGLGNAEQIGAVADRVIAGTTTNGVTFLAPGEVVHAGRGETVLGPWKGAIADDARRVADVLAASGLPASVTPDVRRELWAKVVVNAAINPLTAVLRVPNGALLRNTDLQELLKRVAREGAAVARAGGIDLDPDELAAKVVEVAAGTAENRSSMLQDMELGRKTEIDTIVGEMLRVAAANMVDTPYLRMLDALVRGAEGSWKALA